MNSVQERAMLDTIEEIAWRTPDLEKTAVRKISLSTVGSQGFTLAELHAGGTKYLSFFIEITQVPYYWLHRTKMSAVAAVIKKLTLTSYFLFIKSNKYFTFGHRQSFPLTRYNFIHIIKNDGKSFWFQNNNSRTLTSN